MSVSDPIAATIAIVILVFVIVIGLMIYCFCWKTNDQEEKKEADEVVSTFATATARSDVNNSNNTDNANRNSFYPTQQQLYSPRASSVPTSVRSASKIRNNNNKFIFVGAEDDDGGNGDVQATSIVPIPSSHPKNKKSASASSSSSLLTTTSKNQQHSQHHVPFPKRIADGNHLYYTVVTDFDPIAIPRAISSVAAATAEAEENLRLRSAAKKSNDEKTKTKRHKNKTNFDSRSKYQSSDNDEEDDNYDRCGDGSKVEVFELNLSEVGLGAESNKYTAFALLCELAAKHLPDECDWEEGQAPPLCLASVDLDEARKSDFVEFQTSYSHEGGADDERGQRQSQHRKAFDITTTTTNSTRTADRNSKIISVVNVEELVANGEAIRGTASDPLVLMVIDADADSETNKPGSVPVPWKPCESFSKGRTKSKNATKDNRKGNKSAMKTKKKKKNTNNTKNNDQTSNDFDESDTTEATKQKETESESEKGEEGEEKILHQSYHDARQDISVDVSGISSPRQAKDFVPNHHRHQQRSSIFDPQFPTLTKNLAFATTTINSFSTPSPSSSRGNSTGAVSSASSSSYGTQKKSSSVNNNSNSSHSSQSSFFPATMGEFTPSMVVPILAPRIYPYSPVITTRTPVRITGVQYRDRRTGTFVQDRWKVFALDEVLWKLPAEFFETVSNKINKIINNNNNNKNNMLRMHHQQATKSALKQSNETTTKKKASKHRFDSDSPSSSSSSPSASSSSWSSTSRSSTDDDGDDSNVDALANQKSSNSSNDKELSGTKKPSEIQQHQHQHQHQPSVLPRTVEFTSRKSTASSTSVIILPHLTVTACSDGTLLVKSVPKKTAASGGEGGGGGNEGSSARAKKSKTKRKKQVSYANDLVVNDNNVNQSTHSDSGDSSSQHSSYNQSTVQLLHVDVVPMSYAYKVEGGIIGGGVALASSSTTTASLSRNQQQQADSRWIVVETSQDAVKNQNDFNNLLFKSSSATLGQVVSIASPQRQRNQFVIHDDDGEGTSATSTCPWITTIYLPLGRVCVLAKTKGDEAHRRSGKSEPSWSSVYTVNAASKEDTRDYSESAALHFAGI